MCPILFNRTVVVLFQQRTRLRTINFSDKSSCVLFFHLRFGLLLNLRLLLRCDAGRVRAGPYLACAALAPPGWVASGSLRGEGRTGWRRRSDRRWSCPVAWDSETDTYGRKIWLATAVIWTVTGHSCHYCSDDSKPSSRERWLLCMHRFLTKEPYIPY